MKRVLVTGATGFIGSAAVPFLLERGFEVHAVSSRENSSPVNNSVVWHKMDLLTGNIENLVSQVKPTHLLHLGWFTQPGKFWTSLENIPWTIASLKLATTFANSGGTRAVFAGTCAEYDWNFGYCKEDVTPCSPRTLYGECKLSLWRILQSLFKQDGKSIAWGRIFWLYGQREHPDRLVPSIIRSLLSGNKARCTHGRQLRDFLHADDVASAFVMLLDSSATGAFNICSGAPVSIREIAERIARKLNSISNVEFGSIASAPNDPPLIVGHPARLIEEVGWQPRFSLDMGLDDAIAFWKSRQGA
jgi:nucleoside-diphosphate-sugar epimerase